MGRIVENMQEFLELVVNCPYWEEYVKEDEYESIEKLHRFTNMKMNQFVMELAQDVLMRLYITAKRSPLYDGVYTEENGNQNHMIGCVFTKE